MNFNNWKYLSGKYGTRILPSSEKAIPSSFIKYYGIDNYSVDAVTNKYLFFSHPLSLNDPFDSCIQLVSLEKLSERQFVELYERNQSLFNPHKTYTKDEIKRFVSRWYRENKDELAAIFLNFFWNQIFKDWGILSLAGIENDMLMWAYYSRNQGFAVEFDNQIFERRNVLGPFPINYCKYYETIMPKEIKLSLEQILYITNVKYLKWEHENEWRFLLNNEDMSIPNYSDPSLHIDKRKVTYPESKIKSLILGYKFFEENFTGEIYERNKRRYKFKPDKNEKDKLRVQLLNHILESNISLRGIEISEDNTYTLNTVNLDLVCDKKDSSYFVISK